MSEQKKMDEQDFQNYQRVLSGHTSSSLTIMGFTLTFLAAGFAGIFTIASTEKVNKDFWNMGLGIIMLVIMLILSAVWLREKALGAQAVKDLRKAKIVFPETPDWEGSTASMWRFVFLASVIFWTVFTAFSMRALVAACGNAG